MSYTGVCVENAIQNENQSQAEATKAVIEYLTSLLPPCIPLRREDIIDVLHKMGYVDRVLDNGVVFYVDPGTEDFIGVDQPGEGPDPYVSFAGCLVQEESYVLSIEACVNGYYGYTMIKDEHAMYARVANQILQVIGVTETRVVIPDGVLTTLPVPSWVVSFDTPKSLIMMNDEGYTLVDTFYRELNTWWHKREV